MKTQIIEGPARFEMPLIHQAFAPFHNPGEYNSCFLRGPFDRPFPCSRLACLRIAIDNA